MSALDTDIDALYALPLGEFTAARNALAKGLKGADAAAVKALQKPTAVPYAVNQLYWHDRRTFDRLLAAGQAMRRAQLSALSGSAADMARAQADHRQALSAAAAAASRTADERGVKPQIEPLTRMLEAISLLPELPAPAGRLIEFVQPAGFEAFAAIAAALPSHASSRQPPPAAGAPRKSAREDAAAAKERRRIEDAAARSAAETAVERARKDLAQAVSAEERAQALVDLVQQQLDTATRALREAGATATRAKAALHTAEAALGNLSHGRDR